MENIVKLLNSYEQKDWFALLDSVFNSKPLPTGFDLESNTPAQYLIKLNNVVLESGRPSLKNIYHNRLFEYYFNLIPNDKYSPIVSAFHWVFSAIKPSVPYINKLENQFTSEYFIDLYWDKMYLHTSLLALLSDLEVSNKEKILNYLFQNALDINDYSFRRVALRFFIKNRSPSEFFVFFENLFINSDNRLGSVLAKSLIELRDAEGSYLTILNWFSSRWKYLSNLYPEKANFLKSHLDSTLNYLSANFKNDYTAILFKAMINFDKPLPAQAAFDVISSPAYHVFLEPENYAINSPLKQCLNALLLPYRMQDIYSVSYLDSRFMLSLEIEDEQIKELASMYKISELDEIRFTELDEQQFEYLNTIIYSDIFKKLQSC